MRWLDDGIIVEAETMDLDFVLDEVGKLANRRMDLLKRIERIEIEHATLPDLRRQAGALSESLRELFRALGEMEEGLLTDTAIPTSGERT